MALPGSIVPTAGRVNWPMGGVTMAKTMVRTAITRLRMTAGGVRGSPSQEEQDLWKQAGDQG